MATKQKDAVYEEVCAVKGATTFTDPVELTKEERKTVMTNLVAGLESGAIEFKGDLTDKPALSTYTSGLVSNWLRKDSRLNGNTKYTPANPGTRTGSGDESVKAMRTLLANTEDEEGKKEIQAELDKRLAELKPQPKINVDALPEHLKHLAPATPTTQQ